MQEGEISEPFKTDFGYHIITLEKIRGQEYDVAHILLTPKVSTKAVKEAKERLNIVEPYLLIVFVLFCSFSGKKALTNLSQLPSRNPHPRFQCLNNILSLFIFKVSNSSPMVTFIKHVFFQPS